MNTEQPIYPKICLKQYQDLFNNGLALSTDSDGNLISIPISGSTPSGKIPKSIAGADMPADNIAIYELTNADISGLGACIDVINPMVNNSKSYCDWSFDGNQGSLVAGNKIFFSGLPAKSDVTKFTWSLI